MLGEEYVEQREKAWEKEIEERKTVENFLNKVQSQATGSEFAAYVLGLADGAIQTIIREVPEMTLAKSLKLGCDYMTFRRIFDNLSKNRQLQFISS